ncbi:MAG: hypothetical protein O2931_11175, partial [Planctomycetota bacterium]|nr:hypothetical protein [Planctomycetota bacterium]
MTTPKSTSSPCSLNLFRRDEACVPFVQTETWAKPTRCGNATRSLVIVMALILVSGQVSLGQVRGSAERSAAQEKELAVRLLKQARQSMSQGNYDQAEQYVSEAENLNVKLESLLRPLADTPTRVRKDLDRLRSVGRGGIPSATRETASGLHNPGATDARTPAPRQISGAPGNSTDGTTWIEATAAESNADVIENPHAGLPPVVAAGQLSQSGTVSGLDAKRASLQLIAQAKSALDKQEIEKANALVQQAVRLGVPASAYAPGEMQPWLLQLQINQALKRRDGVAVASAADTTTEGKFPVKSGVYQPNADQSRVVPASSNIE